jgi:hypothetical protein
MKLLISILFLAMTGCASWKGVMGASLTNAERMSVVSHARSLALASSSINEAERAVVATNDPNLAHYFLSGVHFAQYSITWKFSEQDGVTVCGQGDLLTLAGAQVKRLPGNQKPRLWNSLKANAFRYSRNTVWFDDPEGQKMVAGGDRGTREPPVNQEKHRAPAGAKERNALATTRPDRSCVPAGTLALWSSFPGVPSFLSHPWLLSLDPPGRGIA